MKLYITFFLILISIKTFAQEKNANKIISDIFFGFDLSNKPPKIEQEYRMLYDSGAEIEKEKNVIKFNTHPYFDNLPYNHSIFSNGYFNVLYAFNDKDLFEKYGLYVLKISMQYKNQVESKNLFDLLVSKFDDYGSKTFVNRTVNEYNIEIENETIFQKERYSQIPRLEFQYLTFEEDEHDPNNKNVYYQITILYTNSWDLKKLKSYDGKFY
ncbi:hypothetical protein [Flavobacterium noncentrifugens]|uniref:Uncharacterized protein n=3 Tax=Flavobacterium noncentrifugens TaxID=1128970 RepID=A0A1G9DGE4_9FLAO|nr:hypothetical protein [Flavobacterium noncentrifugens]SDK62935.1 hypothetical protein SAMN04487935_3813 [Flavobacterium noncentrifugens]